MRFGTVVAGVRRMIRLRRVAVTTALVGTLFAPSIAAAGDFHSDTGAVTLAPRGTLFGFESEAELSKFTTVKRSDPYTLKEAASDAEWLAEGGIEGKGAVRLGASGAGLSFTDSSVFENLANERFEVRFWAKSEGSEPHLEVVYRSSATRTPLDGSTLPTAGVRAIPTGRETSDGWVEYSTGGLNGNVLGRNVYALFVVPARNAIDLGGPSSGSTFTERGTFLIDALEILSLSRSAIKSGSCTDKTSDSACGVGGECFAGSCVPAETLWGALPSAAQREEIVDREIFVQRSLQGDRSVAPRLPAYEAKLKALVGATSARTFGGGLEHALVELRNMHTSSARLTAATSLYSDIAYQTAGAVGGCFGLVDRDVGGAGAGFAVFDAAPNATVKRGDLLVKVDGEDALTWVRRAYVAYAGVAPGDAVSDDVFAAISIGDLTSYHASEVTLERCTDATCTTKTELSVKIADRVRAAIVDGRVAELIYTIPCDGRVSRIGALGSGPPETETFRSVPKDATGLARIEFDGFSSNAFTGEASQAFSDATPQYLVDARLGRGGQRANAAYLLDLVFPRDTSPTLLMLGRSLFDAPLDAALACSGQNSFDCLFAGALVLRPSGTGTTSRMGAKMAWLNGASVSANDIVPLFVKGRPNSRIFAAVPSAGAYGAIGQVGPLLPGRSMETIQLEDSRPGKDLESAKSAPLTSGKGVVPDVVVVQKLSDLLQGKDTAVMAAEAWLAEGSPR